MQFFLMSQEQYIKHSIIFSIEYSIQILLFHLDLSYCPVSSPLSNREWPVLLQLSLPGRKRILG